MAKITAKMRIRTLLELHPDAEDTLAWYGIELTPSDMGQSLEALCESNDVNFWEVKLDLIGETEDILDSTGFGASRVGDEDEDEDEDDYDSYSPDDEDELDGDEDDLEYDELDEDELDEDELDEDDLDEDDLDEDDLGSVLGAGRARGHRSGK